MTATATPEVKTAAQILDGVNEPIKSLAARIEDMITLDVASGLAPENEKGSVYKTGLELNNVTADEAERVHKAETNIVAAHQLAIGNIGNRAFAEHKDLGTVQGSIAMHGDNVFTAGINRTAIARNPKTGETTEVVGQTFNSYQISTSANKGQMGKVRNAIRAAALEGYGKK